jgi:hypothetical protein
MLEPDQWEDVLSKVTGTVYRGTERISSNALLNLLEVGPDPVLRQKMGKRCHRMGTPWMGITLGQETFCPRSPHTQKAERPWRRPDGVTSRAPARVTDLLASVKSRHSFERVS